MKYIFLLIFIISTDLFAQKDVTQDWNAFSQGFDMTPYQGG